MSFQYVDPALPKRIEGWHSEALGLDMPIASYGDSGRPLLLFPTAAADFLENERFFLIKSIEPAIMAGRLRVFSIESINRLSWMGRGMPVKEKARRQALYQSYIEGEVVPYIRNACGDAGVRIMTAGASFGAFHAGNTMFRRPDLFDGLIGMSGFYDLAPDYFHGYSDDNCYFNNPMWFVENLEGESLETLRSRSRIVLVTGQGEYEAPQATVRFSDLLRRKEIPHDLDLWGFDMRHDWPTWRTMLPYWVDKLGH